MIIQHLVRHLLLALVIGQVTVHWSTLQQFWCRSNRQRKKCKKQSRCSTASRAPTRRPPCPLCQAAEEQSANLPPPMIEQKRGRPREVDTHNHYCPNKKCPYYGWIGRGNITANGHPNSGRWRQLHCIVCGRYFMETEGTIFFRSSVPTEKILQAMAALAEGVNMRKVARIFKVDPNTVLDWLVQAAPHVEAVCRYMLHDLHLDHVQMDELYALLSQTGQGQEEEADVSAHKRRRRSHQWVWAAIDPVSKLLLAVVVGDRSLATAQLLVHATIQALAPGVVPLFLTDQLAHYATALLTHFGHWVATPRRFRRGAPPKPRWMPIPTLRYAQVVKRRMKGRVVEVSYRVVYGTAEAVQSALEHIGWKINTAFIERLNRTLRHHVPALGRRVESLAKTAQGLRRQALLVRGYYNFCLPHSSLRVPLPQPIPTKGTGSPKKWQPRTPTMAAGVTDHVWSMEELLLFRVPPWAKEVTA